MVTVHMSAVHFLREKRKGKHALAPPGVVFAWVFLTMVGHLEIPDEKGMPIDTQEVLFACERILCMAAAPVPDAIAMRLLLSVRCITRKTVGSNDPKTD